MKDKTYLVTTFNLYSSYKPHYVQVYVWENNAALMASTVQEPVPEGKKVTACHCACEWQENTQTGELTVLPKLGELHFVWNDFDEEVVAHELQHAIVHRMRVLPPSAQQVIDQQPSIDASEEIICREYGRWFARLWARLFRLWQARQMEFAS